MTTDGTLDEAYERLHQTGPEFNGWLSNHGPMAADSLIRIGRSAEVHSWVDSYAERLHGLPQSRWPMTVAEWPELLGDPSRLGDWLALFDRIVREAPWEDVLAEWWPRLLPGGVASATHGLIRTGQAVRALREQVTEPRLTELGQGLGYWAARWQPIPGAPDPRGQLPVVEAMDRLPAVVTADGIGVRTRMAWVAGDRSWRDAVAAHEGAFSAADVPRALDGLVDSAVTFYASWGRAQPVMLVHAATAPRAAALALPSLPESEWIPTYDAAWRLTAALTSAYRTGTVAPASLPVGVEEAAVSSDDEHAIKFAEVAYESHQRGNPAALGAAQAADTWLGGDG